MLDGIDPKLDTDPYYFANAQDVILAAMHEATINAAQHGATDRGADNMIASAIHEELRNRGWLTTARHARQHGRVGFAVGTVIGLAGMAYAYETKPGTALSCLVTAVLLVGGWAATDRIVRRLATGQWRSHR